MRSWLSLTAVLAVSLFACKEAPPPTANEAKPQAAAEAAAPPPQPASQRPSEAPSAAQAGPPFLWRIDTKVGPSYLFGTMHLGVSADKDVHPMVWDALAKSERVTLEIIGSELSFSQTQELLFLPDGQSLRKDLSEKQWGILKKNVKGFPEAQLGRVSPLMASVLISSQWLPSQTPLDQVIEARARTGEKQVFGLEGFTETKSFTQNPAHVKYLAVMLEDLDRAKKELAEMHAAYLAGDAEAMLSLVFSEENQAKFPELYEQLFYQRNRAWVPKLEKQLAQGKAFIAVGAGHLLGEQSVVALLRAKGYEAKRVEPSK